MTWVTRGLVLSMLALCAWKVHEARALWATSRSGRPDRVAAMQARLDALPLDGINGEWTGTPLPFAANREPRGGADCYIRRRYVNPSGGEVTLYVAGAAHYQERFHTPNFCMIAQGWEQRDYDEGPFFQLPGIDPDATMARLVAEYGSRRMVAYYWLMVDGALREPRWGQRLQRFLDLLAGREASSNYLVVVYVPAGGDLKSTERVAAAFVGAIMPSLQTATQAEE